MTVMHTGDRTKQAIDVGARYCPATAAAVSDLSGVFAGSGDGGRGLSCEAGIAQRVTAPRASSAIEKCRRIAIEKRRPEAGTGHAAPV